MIKGIALYLLYGQLMPYARTAELLTDFCGCHISPGTIEAFVVEGADRLIEAEELIKQALRETGVIGHDEMGVRVRESYPGCMSLVLICLRTMPCIGSEASWLPTRSTFYLHFMGYPMLPEDISSATP